MDCVLSKIEVVRGTLDLTNAELSLSIDNCRECGSNKLRQALQSFTSSEDIWRWREEDVVVPFMSDIM